MKTLSASYMGKQPILFFPLGFAHFSHVVPTIWTFAVIVIPQKLQSFLFAQNLIEDIIFVSVKLGSDKLDMRSKLIYAYIWWGVHK